MLFYPVDELVPSQVVTPVGCKKYLIPLAKRGAVLMPSSFTCALWQRIPTSNMYPTILVCCFAEEILIDPYRCVFLAKHPNDMSTSDKFSRFWPEWYRFTCCSKNNIMYSDRISIRLGYNPDIVKFMQWSNNLPLLGSSLYSHSIIGHFNFENWRIW